MHIRDWQYEIVWYYWFGKSIIMPGLLFLNLINSSKLYAIDLVSFIHEAVWYETWSHPEKLFIPEIKWVPW